MTADNLPALRTSTALAVIPKPPTKPTAAHSTSSSLFLLAGVGTALTAFTPLGVATIPAAIGMGSAALVAAGLGIHERIRERRT